MNICNKKNYLLFLTMIGNAFFCQAQYTLQKEYVYMRPNDTIVKQEVAYKDPGRSGSGVFWNFNKLQVTKPPYRICYGGNEQFISAMEHLTVYSYAMNAGDSLFLSAYRNRTTYFNAILPGIEFKYPFHYLDSVENVFYGEGKYSDKLAFVSQGKSKVTADAYGTMLLPDNDTLRNVMRICFQKEICEQVANNDSILLRLHGDSTVLDRELILSHCRNDEVILRMKDYRWYAEGYRYPVFETMRCETIRSGIPIAYFATAFYYPPEEHLYIDKDTLNELLLEKLKAQSLTVNKPGIPSEEDGNRMQSDLSVYYNIYPNPVKNELKLEYYLSEKAPISIHLFDLSGRLLNEKGWNMQEPGIHTEAFPMDAYPNGHYLLQLIVSGKMYVEKIVKE